MRLSLLPIVALAGSVLASGDTITAAIDDIANATLALNKTIATWPPYPHWLPAPRSLWSFDETLQVAQATINLAADVNTTLETVIRAKPDFDRLLLSPVILLNLKLQQDASEDFSSAVIEKVPEELQGNAETLTKGIDDSFVKAIKKYSSLRRR
ncbi:hypothetical protein NM208_g12616 [Fusarium decemcellulare]|uniref:Uncharacterized protein n=1 Tax=Fusarium decemcellulare TaxID=57161 RepID=A0ACC1RPP0_9HYPO|nr:hypothetical protein NM208_g12616 [Fusarium decemcellulare]